MTARPIFFGGTSSNAGKSWMATAACAWLRRRGVRVAPFKAQTMSNHSLPVSGGRRDWSRPGGAGRSLRARARAGDEPDSAQAEWQRHEPGRSSTDGCGRRCRRAATTRTSTRWPPRSRAAYDDLAGRFDVIVIEGAGSVSELNLRPFDLVNLGLVTRLGAPWVLVADIERGGVFASILGTAALLTRGGARALSRIPRQQVPRRSIALRRGARAARGAKRRALSRRVSLRRRFARRCRGQPGRRRASTDAGPGGRVDGDREIAAPVERHGFSTPVVGRLGDGAFVHAVRLRHSARHQGHARAISRGFGIWGWTCGCATSTRAAPPWSASAAVFK